MKNRYLASLVVLALSAPAAAFATPVISDASFETPALSFGGYQYNSTGTAWTFTGNAGVSSAGGPFFSGSPPDGSQAAFFQTAPQSENGNLTGVISQTISGFVVGATYQLGFYLASRPGYAVDPLSVMLGSIALGTYTNSSTSFLQEFSASFVATSTSATLLFTSNTVQTAGEQDANIDAVTITQVPEPSSLALLGLGVGAMALRRRRGTKTAAA